MALPGQFNIFFIGFRVKTGSVPKFNHEVEKKKKNALVRKRGAVWVFPNLNFVLCIQSKQQPPWR